ncbi:unnamed protein product [Mesocestoides corti]|uniref:JmjC domain-containing protein n=2 Tax=Mesocestoides corti TaxID=53468 RepID=A0A158QVM0_MESCO|nr:unnamed protein product [Mesocestoides corti]
MGPAAGTPSFIEKLLQVEFLDPDPFVDYKAGEEVNGFNLINEGFRKPIVVSHKVGLRMKVPPANFSLRDVVAYTDPSIIIDVIDVLYQTDMQLSLGEFVDEFYEKPRERLLNVLSFEYSQTRLAKFIRPPHVVKELSLVDNCWAEPTDEDDECGTGSSERPNVQKYCLMSMAGSYTDFHIDFGGSSVWYHVLWGEKIFYVTPPSKDHLEAYWRWNGLLDNRRVFFPDTINKIDSRIPVARLHLKAGETVLLPAGWIHAVYTPTDSLVFGGNFLTQLSIPLQLGVYHMEVKQGTSQRFLFPFFEKLHWYAADVILGRLTNDLYAGQEPPTYLLKAAHALLRPLSQWFQQRKVLPKGQRNYYLPARTYLQYACPTLIGKLEEVVQAFLSKLHPTSSSSGRRRRRKRPHRSPVRRESPSSGHTSSTSPQVYDPCDQDRASLNPRSEDNAEAETPSSMSEVLQAVPELRNSRLIGDHYVFSLPESGEESGVRSSSRKRLLSRRRLQPTPKDPDPTWCASPSTLGKRKRPSTKKPHLKQAFVQPRHMSSDPFRASSHAIHRHQPPSTSRANFPTTSSAVAVKTSRKPAPVRREKTTVRQRLAKRLGL